MINKVRIIGLKETQRRLKRVADEVNKALPDIVSDALQPMQAATIANAPVGETGRLRGAVRIRIKKSAKGAYGVVEISRQDVGVSADDKNFYPAYVERGTRYQSGQWFLRRAFNAYRGQAEASIARDIAKVVDKASRGI